MVTGVTAAQRLLRARGGGAKRASILSTHLLPCAVYIGSGGNLSILRWYFRSHALCVRDDGTLPPAT
jgi:hypothetical protein